MCVCVCVCVCGVCICVCVCVCVCVSFILAEFLYIFDKISSLKKKMLILKFRLRPTMEEFSIYITLKGIHDYMLQRGQQNTKN